MGRNRVAIPPREFELLALFLGHPGALLSRDEILDGVWGPRLDVSANVVDVYVCYLRRRLGAWRVPFQIATVRGVGYRFEPLKDDRSLNVEERAPGVSAITEGTALNRAA